MVDSQRRCSGTGTSIAFVIYDNIKMSYYLYMEPQAKKLYRSKTDKVFAGICGGMAEYLQMDVTVIRLLWVLAVIFTGIFPGVIIYILAIFIIPVKP